MRHDGFIEEAQLQGCKSVATLTEAQDQICLFDYPAWSCWCLQLTIGSSDLEFWAKERRFSSFWRTTDTRWCPARPSAGKESPFSPFEQPASFWIFRAPLFWSSAHASIIWKFRINPFCTIKANLWKNGVSFVPGKLSGKWVASVVENIEV